MVVELGSRYLCLVSVKLLLGFACCSARLVLVNREEISYEKFAWLIP